ncbi:piwi domain-containing protein [Ditylenchus destructor]|uniref:Piwi domain-containing protein n=1 Tax=Ditylenchus destructor TaxID=166010 RepID=A0AAD4MP06_9BILA|nr:piwi domain-containing protein [Ditylenchus destructor]
MYGSFFAQQNQPLPQFAALVNGIQQFEVNTSFVNFIKNAVCEHYNETGSFPKELIVYCSGLREVNDDKMWLVFVNSFRQGMMGAHNIKCRDVELMFPKLVVIRVSRGNYRLFQNERRNLTHPPLGTCIDMSGLDPEKSEFILLSDFSEKEMASPTLYTVVYDSPGDRVPLKQLEHLTWSLCFGYGTNKEPLAVPSPLISAMELSKRGRTNWMAGRYLAKNIYFPEGSGLMGTFNGINSRFRALTTMFWA